MQTNQLSNNIVGFKSDTVLNKIELFLEKAREESENTYISYGGHIKEYFMYVLGKELNELTWDDLYGLTVEDTWRYKLYLGKKRVPMGRDENGKRIYKNGQSPSTINSKIACLSALFKFLQSIDKQINSMIMNVKRAKPTGKNVSYGSLTEVEFNQLLEFCDKTEHKPLTKRMFFEIAINTGMRKTAILSNLKWENISKAKDNQSGIFINVIRDVEDKGGKSDIIPVSDTFHERLMEFRDSDEVEYNGIQDKDKRVVSLDPKTVEKVLRDFKKEYDIEDERKITIHSIKSTGCDMVWEKTKDIKAVSDYAHHADINTTYKHYLGKNESLMDKASYYVFDSKIDVSDLDKLSKEQIIELISKCSISAISEIMTKIEEI